MSPLNPDELLTVKQARSILPMSPAWYAKHRWLGSGVPAVVIGNRALYRRADLVAFIDAHRKPMAAPAAPAAAQGVSIA